MQTKIKTQKARSEKGSANNLIQTKSANKFCGNNIEKRNSVFKNKQTLHTETQKILVNDLKECRFKLSQNEMLFNLETDELLVEQRIYEKMALECRYNYLINRARDLGVKIGVFLI